MMMMGIDLPLQAIQRQVASALDIIIHLGRIRDKTRKVIMIEEILGYEDGKIQTKTLYEFKEVGTENEKVKGSIMKVAELENTAETYALQDIKKQVNFLAVKSIAVILLITYVFYESFLPIFFMIHIWVIYARDGLRDLCRKGIRVQFSNAKYRQWGGIESGILCRKCDKRSRKRSRTYV